MRSVAGTVGSNQERPGGRVAEQALRVAVGLLVGGSAYLIGALVQVFAQLGEYAVAVTVGVSLLYAWLGYGLFGRILRQEREGRENGARIPAKQDPGATR